ncbi:MAG: TIGR02186 family protein [Beijerinckiaceae bacterium]
MKRLLWLTALLLYAPVAQAETLIVSLATHRVQIMSNYTGAQLAVFGVIERDARTVARVGPLDLAITVRGPRETVIVHEKQQTFGIWINRDRRTFRDIPSFVQVLSTRPIQDFMDPERARRYQLGLRPIITPPAQAIEVDARADDFRASLVRLRYENGLYRENERGVTFLTPNVVQASIALPAAAPLGSYDVEVSLFSDGVLLTKQTTNFEVVKAGFEQAVADAAANRPMQYGLAAAFLSILFGWLASVAFRKD